MINRLTQTRIILNIHNFFPHMIKNVFFTWISPPTITLVTCGKFSWAKTSPHVSYPSKCLAENVVFPRMFSCLCWDVVWDEGLSVVTIRPLLTGPPCPRPCPRAQPPSIKCPRYHHRIVSPDWRHHCRQTLKSLKIQANVPTFSKILVTEYLLLLLANANALWLFKSAVKVLMTKIKFDQNTSSWIFLLLICHILFINWKLMDLALHEMWSAPKWLVSLPRTWCVVS